MFDVFKLIGVFISAFVNMITDTVADIISFFGSLVQAQVFINTIVLSLPPFCQGAIIAILGVSIITLLCSIFVDFS